MKLLTFIVTFCFFLANCEKDKYIRGLEWFK